MPVPLRRCGVVHRERVGTEHCVAYGEIWCGTIQPTWALPLLTTNGPRGWWWSFGESDEGRHAGQQRESGKEEGKEKRWRQWWSRFSAWRFLHTQFWRRCAISRSARAFYGDDVQSDGRKSKPFRITRCFAPAPTPTPARRKLKGLRTSTAVFQGRQEGSARSDAGIGRPGCAARLLREADDRMDCAAPVCAQCTLLSARKRFFFLICANIKFSLHNFLCLFFHRVGDA